MSEDVFDVSKLRFYSIGVAAEDNDTGRWGIRVSPLEQLNFMDGEINADVVTIDSSGIDAGGQTYADQVDTANSFMATWIGIGESNRRTAPNVVVGEQLILFTYADTGEYFWTPRNQSRALRRLETAVFAFSASPAAGAKELNDDNSYIVEISAHQKRLTLSTSKANGEVAAYTFQLNGGEGLAILSDDMNNEIAIHSTGNRISLINADNTEFHLDGPNLKFKLAGIVEAEASGAVLKVPTMDIPGVVHVKKLISDQDIDAPNVS